ncbi:hypothetical protein Ami103574_08140 [Aminipila butyrica]|uniref:PIN domain-containing protein n=1 Tax=Aminipila butyrica TaxID=433296 RepID=A0A858BX48_9FIRM|nr:hypothetical protein [Aminipila butyrica]QIB69294.1 hypothetical protein Ami103574_08140 [Aminipila butyrica]
MADIKYYKQNIGAGRNLYCIDSNILINVGKFYFDGRCGRDDTLTEQVKKFIILCRNTGTIIYDYALLEISFNFGTNKINADVMNKFMMVIDTLFMNCADEEVINHAPQFKPFCKEKLSGEFNSIFDCKLPQIIFSDEIGSLKIFYLMYLYTIIIFYLSNCKIEPMEKVKKLYAYMTEEINCFMAHEFQLGQMIFIGTQKEKNIAEGIMKFGKIKKGKSAIRILINALLDIMSYRRLTMIKDMSILQKAPVSSIFVTQDQGLQNYIELNSDFKTVINGDKITDSFTSEFVPEEKYLIEWKEFYYETIITNAKNRFMEYHLGRKREVDQEKILKEIKYYEKLIFGY